MISDKANVTYGSVKVEDGRVVKIGEKNVEHTVETVLWQNEDTITSSYEFKPDGTGTGQRSSYASPITLADSVVNFDYVVLLYYDNRLDKNMICEEIKIDKDKSNYKSSESSESYCNTSSSPVRLQITARSITIKSNKLYYQKGSYTEIKKDSTSYVDGNIHDVFIPYKIIGIRYSD